MEEDKGGGVECTYGVEEKCVRVLCGGNIKREHLEDLGVDGGHC